MAISSLPVPYDRILEETRLKVAIARQHLTVLATFGLTSKWLDELELKANEAEKIPSNTQQLGEQKALTAVKDTMLVYCVEWGRKLRLRMELAYKDRPTLGMQFPSKEWRESERNESRMIVLMPSLIQLARQQAEVLTTVGQTQEDITQGETLHNQLKVANEAQEAFKLARPSTTSQRQEVFRQLYEGVNRINQIGQASYGSDSTNSLLFRSNWGLGNKAEVKLPEQAPIDISEQEKVPAS